jgi:hypothetical protein
MQLTNSQEGDDHGRDEIDIRHDFLRAGGNRSEEIMVLGKPNDATQKMKCIDCSEKDELQRVLNALRNWVLDRNGVPFTMNYLYADPAISPCFSVSIQTMILIDRALLALRCTIDRENQDTVSFQNLVYTPPKVIRVHRDLMPT